MNAHQKHGFLMCIVATCVKNDGFLCTCSATCTEKRSFAARPAMADEVEAPSAKVGEHLKRMGVVWN